MLVKAGTWNNQSVYVLDCELSLVKKATDNVPIWVYNENGDIIEILKKDLKWDLELVITC